MATSKVGPNANFGEQIEITVWKTCTGLGLWAAFNNKASTTLGGSIAWKLNILTVAENYDIQRDVMDHD